MRRMRSGRLDLHQADGVPMTQTQVRRGITHPVPEADRWWLMAKAALIQIKV